MVRAENHRGTHTHCLLANLKYRGSLFKGELQESDRQMKSILNTADRHDIQDAGGKGTSEI